MWLLALFCLVKLVCTHHFYTRCIVAVTVPVVFIYIAVVYMNKNIPWRVDTHLIPHASILDPCSYKGRNTRVRIISAGIGGFVGTYTKIRDGLYMMGHAYANKLEYYGPTNTWNLKWGLGRQPAGEWSYYAKGHCPCGGPPLTGWKLGRKTPGPPPVFSCSGKKE